MVTYTYFSLDIPPRHRKRKEGNGKKQKENLDQKKGKAAKTRHGSATSEHSLSHKIKKGKGGPLP